MTVDSQVRVGSVLEKRYRLIGLLGQGGTGSVYLAEDTQLFDRQVAVKELIEQFSTAEEREAAVARFADEARMLVSLDHPNLPDVRSYFVEDGRHYLVMEYVEGNTLLEMLARHNGVIHYALVVAWGRQICEVLAYLHGRTPPVIFRDLKPSNIMLDRHGRIKLIDFGTARLFDPAKHTDTLKMGSIGFAPPEQYQGQGQTSPQTDIYALGATMHQLLTNQDPSARPFVFTPPSLLRPEIPESLSRAVMHALNLDPAQRFASATEMRHALEAGSIDSPTALLPVAPTEPNPFLMAFAGLVGAALLELLALAPELRHFGQGQGLASGNWLVVYGAMLGAALGAAGGGALVPGYIRHRLRATAVAFCGSALLAIGTGTAVIFGIGHGDPKQFSLRLLAVLVYAAATVGAALLRGLGAGE